MENVVGLAWLSGSKFKVNLKMNSDRGTFLLNSNICCVICYWYVYQYSTFFLRFSILKLTMTLSLSHPSLSLSLSLSISLSLSVSLCLSVLSSLGPLRLEPEMRGYLWGSVDSEAHTGLCIGEVGLFELLFFLKNTRSKDTHLDKHQTNLPVLNLNVYPLKSTVCLSALSPSDPSAPPYPP